MCLFFHPVTCDINGTYSKTMVMKGHKGAVMEAHFSKDGSDVYSCSTDGTLGIWDSSKGFRKAVLEGHTAGVNSVQAARTSYPVLCSGSNDGIIRIWDVREKECVVNFQRYTNVTAVCFTEDGQHIISGGLDCDITIYDIRARETVCTLLGHRGRVTGVSLSPCGCYLLSNSIDNTLRVWDIRSHVTFKRCVSCFPSYQQYGDAMLRCAWSRNGRMVS